LQRLYSFAALLLHVVLQPRVAAELLRRQTALCSRGSSLLRREARRGSLTETSAHSTTSTPHHALLFRALQRSLARRSPGVSGLCAPAAPVAQLLAVGIKAGARAALLLCHQRLALHRDVVQQPVEAGAVRAELVVAELVQEHVEHCSTTHSVR